MDLTPVFNASDVRGLVPEQLDGSVATRIGAAFTRHTGAARVAVGYDARMSSPALADAFMEGVTISGSDVDDLGVVATDMAYHAAGMLNEPAAMITASHDPKGWNGIKLCLAGARPVFTDTGLEDIRLLAEGALETGVTKGSRSRVDTLEAYVNHVLAVAGTETLADFDVAVDGSNGVAGVVLPLLFERIPCRLSGLYLEPDGTFPNHHPDPLQPENLRDLVALIEAEKPALGVAFGGDADRAIFIDDTGRAVPGSTVTALIAQWFLQREPRSKIVHDLMCSRAVPETIAAAGGAPVRTRVGYSSVNKVMAATNAVFGGEHSGHYYFRDHYRADSGILAMLVLLRILSEADQPLSQLRVGVEPYSQSGEINLRVVDQEAATSAVAAAFDGDHDHLDGLTVTKGDRWFNLRPSYSDPVLRLNVEAPKARDVARLVEEVRAVVGEIG